MNEREYYRRRAEIERACARDAASAEIAALHAELAMRYNLVAETGRGAEEPSEAVALKPPPDKRRRAAPKR